MMINFKLISEFITLQRRSFRMADEDLLKPIPPGGKVPLVDGEYLTLNASYQMDRGAVDPAVVPSWVYAAEQGRYETQTIGKGPILWGGFFEADTLIMDATALGVGDALEVADITVGTYARRGLQKFTSGLVVGRVTRLPANNRNFLRYVRIDN